MYEDERRDPEVTQKMILEEFISDPEELRRKYLGLVERDRRARQRTDGAEKKAAELSATVRRLEKQIDDAQQSKNDLKKRLMEAEGSLTAYRRETRRLKSDLERVRGSRSMKIGRVITSPAALLRPKSTSGADRTAEEVPGEGESAAENTISQAPSAHVAPVSAEGSSGAESPRTTSVGTSDPHGDAPKSGAATTGTAALQPWQLTFEQLEARLAESPTGNVLNALLNRAWFQRGDISKCEKLIADYPDLVSKFPPNGMELVGRVHGEARLRDGRIEVPPRAHGVAYRPEIGRVMYCVHSTPVFDSNGYSTRTRGFVDGLRENDVDVSVVARLGYPWDMHPEAAPRLAERSVVELGGTEYSHLPGADLNHDPLDEYILQAADAYTREARIRRPSRIHAASNFRHALPALIAARRAGVPFIYEVRGLWELTEAVSKDGWEDSERFALQVELETLVASEADQVLAITAQVRDELIARGVHAARIQLAPNAVNEKEFVPLPVDKAYARGVGVTLDRPVIGFAGSLVAYEGLDVLLRAVRLVRDREIPVQVVIAGSGAAGKSLKKLTTELGLDEDVTFLGRVPAQDIPRLMSIMDVMPCPRLSTRVTEMVSPLKPLEALSSGKAVILSDVTPQSDLIPADSARGFLVPAGDEATLAHQLEKVLVDPDIARAAARAGRAWIVENRTWSVLATAIRSAYEHAQDQWDDSLSTVPSRPLASIKVGIVADEFTTVTLASCIQVVPIPRENPGAAITADLDAIFIESAWEGNGGEWHRGIGYYDDEQFASLRKLVWHASQKGVPTIFWNKEDPVHVKRFLRAAVRCDHVFTTDAGLLSRYLASGSAKVRTASALPFYADLSLHNPVQTSEALGASDVMYAGTYYGARYAERSRALATLLRSASEVGAGLTIYDRQFDDPDSPYRFPTEFRRHVRGALPYREVLDAYRSHLANVNVNSVTDSPTMFSRRVVEVAASGGVVLSGPGRGVTETFGDAIPASGEAAFHRAYLHQWRTDPMSRLAEAWFQLRTIARAHTTETALAIMFRTIGIPVDGLSDPPYVAALTDVTEEAVASVLAQSVPPVALAVPEVEVDRVALLAGLPVMPASDLQAVAAAHGAQAIIRFERAPSRTMAEDLLIAHRFRGDGSIVARESSGDIDPRLLAIPSEDAAPLPLAPGRIAALEMVGVPGTEPSSLDLLIPPSAPAVPEKGAGVHESVHPEDVAAKTVLFAGHDLKFIAPYIEELRSQGHEVLIDQWTAHNEHDEDASRALLAQADVVWCEWGLGNAVWYSRHVATEQKLVVRVHLQEIDTPYLRRIEMDAVDQFLFVGELIRRAGIESFGIDASRSVVVPNFVRTDLLRRPKTDEARYTLGLVGIVPQRKRMDLAIDLVEKLHDHDPRYRLRIKGRRPEEYWWMAHRPEEMGYYTAQYERIDAINAWAGTEVIGFDPQGDDMPEWYEGIGTVISTSDFESFHLTLADGAASGSDAVSLAWAGSDLIYPARMLFSDVNDMATAVLDDEARSRRIDVLGQYVESFDASHVFDTFSTILLSDVTR